MSADRRSMKMPEVLVCGDQNIGRHGQARDAMASGKRLQHECDLHSAI